MGVIFYCDDIVLGWILIYDMVMAWYWVPPNFLQWRWYGIDFHYYFFKMMMAWYWLAFIFIWYWFGIDILGKKYNVSGMVTDIFVDIE